MPGWAPDTYLREVRQGRRQDEAVLTTCVLAEQIDTRRRTFGRRRRRAEDRRKQFGKGQVHLHCKTLPGSEHKQAEQNDREQRHAE